MLKRFAVTPALALVLLSTGLAGDSHAVDLPDYENAMQAAAERGVPMLLRIGKGWCSSCSRFDNAVEQDPELLSALSEHVAFGAIDKTTEEGARLARQYSVPDKSYLVFVLANAEGEVMDRWVSFQDSESFLKHLTAAVENPITVNERLARFRAEPNEIDARKLGELREYEGLAGEAVAFYRRARALNPASETNYDLNVVQAMSRGLRDHLFSAAEVRAQADVTVASDRSTPKHLLKLAYTMGKVAKQTENRDQDYFPYLKVAIERSEGPHDDAIAEMRTHLLPEYALHIQKDEKQAVAHKKAALARSADPDNWQENANMLNNFAWWCFEKNVNLVEAEQLARKGVELAEPGKEKANVLDTLAEICNVKGDCGSAVDYIRQAIAEAPDNQYFRSQLERFEELFAAQTR